MGVWVWVSWRARARVCTRFTTTPESFAPVSTMSSSCDRNGAYLYPGGLGGDIISRGHYYHYRLLPTPPPPELTEPGKRDHDDERASELSVRVIDHQDAHE